jgi:hypothetical protein
MDYELKKSEAKKAIRQFNAMVKTSKKHPLYPFK